MKKLKYEARMKKWQYNHVKGEARRSELSALQQSVVICRHVRHNQDHKVANQFDIFCTVERTREAIILEEFSRGGQ